MLYSLLIITLISLLYGYQINNLKCQDLKSQFSCEFAEKQLNQCYWDFSNKQCYQKLKQSLTKSIYNCTLITDISECLSLSYDYQSCTWQHNKCININKCNDINDYKQCRNAKFTERCQIVVNQKASGWQKEIFYITEQFEDFECRQLDCKFNYNGNCENFVNGRRCFQYYDECTQCSYFKSSTNCIDTQQCTWQNNICRNILCSDLNSKQLCQMKPFCEFNDKNMKCENRMDNDLYCYNRDLSSQPLKQHYETNLNL